jgi:hypothetical protein
VDIRFGANGNSDRFVSTGWYSAEPGHRWTKGGFSILTLPLPTVCDYAMLVQMFPYVVEGHVASQRCAVLCGEHVLAEMNLSQPGWVGVRVPAGVISAGGPARLIITFIHPDAGCPKTQLGSEDARLLALGVRRIVVAPTVDELGPETSAPHGIFGPVQPFCGDTLDWAQMPLEITAPVLASNERHAS